MVGATACPLDWRKNRPDSISLTGRAEKTASVALYWRTGGRGVSKSGASRVMWPDANETHVLLQRVAEDEAGAADRLWASYRDPLRRMIDLRLDPMLGRRVDASDVVQDVLVEANRRLGEYLRNPAM